MSRRRASSIDRVGNGSYSSSRTESPVGSSSRSLVLQHQHHHVMRESISEDEESDEHEYETAGILFPPDDCSSSNSSSTAGTPASPHLKSSLILDNHSFNAFENIQCDRGDDHEYHMPFLPPGYHKKALHEELIHHARSSSDSLALPNGAAIVATGPSNFSGSSVQQYYNALVFSASRRKNPYWFAFIMGFTLLGLVVYTKSYATLHNALDQVTTLTQKRKQVREIFLNVEADIQKLQREFFELNQNQGAVLHGASSVSGQVDDNVNHVHGEEEMLLQQRERIVDEMVTLQEKLREGNSRIGSLQKHLQDVSRHDAVEKFGSGVIRVKLELEFPANEKAQTGVGGPNVILLEMAPLDLMPHSVYMFLEMVHAELFDGCSFILNAMHVIKAAPLPYDGSSASQKVKAFTKRGLESVAFREYSSEYPHDKYSVGFAADGSPSFYINTEDNTQEHTGDPCFAKVVAGFDTVARMQSAPTRNGIFFRRRIGIKKATIL